MVVSSRAKHLHIACLPDRFLQGSDQICPALQTRGMHYTVAMLYERPRWSHASPFGYVPLECTKPGSAGTVDVDELSRNTGRQYQ